MKYTISVSDNLTYCFNESELQDIAETVYQNRSGIGQDTVIIDTTHGAVQAERDDMYDIVIYGKGEDTLDSYVSHVIMTVADEDRQSVSLVMPDLNRHGVVEYEGVRYALLQDAYPVDLSDQYMASAVRLSDGRHCYVYWNIVNPDSEWEDNVCDWDEPVDVQEI